jgi:hypothetical protein
MIIQLSKTRRDADDGVGAIASHAARTPACSSSSLETLPVPAIVEYEEVIADATIELETGRPCFELPASP